ncbi:MAG: hypothetical protein II866_11970 [Prevotella sp.]|nr:hypothetical protein [Prevotella sp.]
MKKLLLIMIALLPMTLFAKNLVIKQTNDRQSVISLASEPVVTFEGEKLKVESTGSTILIDMETVTSFTFEDDESGITEKEMKPDFSNGQIKLKNYPANAPVRVASLDGKLLMETKVDSNGESCILLDKFPKGVIIIQVDKMNMKVVNKK